MVWPSGYKARGRPRKRRIDGVRETLRNWFGRLDTKQKGGRESGGSMVLERHQEIGLAVWIQSKRVAEKAADRWC